ncbi:hypothetical protein M3J09_012627 [Ascochyta lentis]
MTRVIPPAIACLSSGNLEQDEQDRTYLAHRRHTTELVEGVDILLEHLLLGVAPLLGNTVTCHSGNGGLRLRNDLAALDVEALQFRERAARTDELGHNGHFLRGIDSFAFAIEVLDADTCRVVVAAVCIT